MQKSLLAVCLLLGGIGCTHPTARIRNESTTRLTNVRISGRGFDVTVPELASGEQRVVTINPRGESGVAVAFDANGRHVKTPGEGYVEDDSMYVVDIVVKPNLSVAVNTDLVTR